MTSERWERRALAVLYLPMSLDAFSDVTAAIAKHYPDAKLGWEAKNSDVVVVEIEEAPNG